MRVYSLNEQERASTGFTHLIKVAWSSVAADNDFNVPALTRVLTAIALQAGDVVKYPLAQVFTKQAPTALTAPTVAVGVSGAAEQFIAIGTPTTGRSLIALSLDAAAGGPFESDGVGRFVTVSLAATNNLNLATAGEILVFVCIIRAADLVKIQG